MRHRGKQMGDELAGDFLGETSLHDRTKHLLRKCLLSFAFTLNEWRYGVLSREQRLGQWMNRIRSDHLFKALARVPQLCAEHIQHHVRVITL